MTQLVLQLGIPAFLEETIALIVAYTPRIVAAILILIIGWIVGRGFARLVTGVTDRVELDRAVLKTPLGRMLGGTERAVSTAFGRLGAWFVYAIALLAAADVLAIQTLSTWISTAVSYLPAFVAGLLVIVLGFVVADFIGGAIERTEVATRTVYTSWFATGVRVFLYFTAVVIGLDTMGIDVTLLNIIVQALAWGVAAAVALGAGIAIGWGGKDYVHDNINRWMGGARETATPSDD